VNVMSDLLIWILILATCQNVLSLTYSHLRLKWVEYRIKKQQEFYFESSVQYYDTTGKTMRLKRHFVYNGIFFASFGALVSNSILDFAGGMLFLGVQLFMMYRLYKHQKPTFYLTEKGIACSMLAHPIEKEQVGLKKWKDVKSYDESDYHLHLAGNHFQYELNFNVEVGRKVRSMARSYIRHSGIS